MLINLHDDVKVLSYFSFACDIDILGFGCGRGEGIPSRFISFEKNEICECFLDQFLLWNVFAWGSGGSYFRL